MKGMKNKMDEEFDIIKITTTSKGDARVQFNINFSTLLNSISDKEIICKVSEQLKNMFISEIDRVIGEYLEKKSLHEN